MKASESLWEAMQRTRLIALLTPASAEACLQAYEVLHPLGVILEIGLRSEAALDGLAAIRRRYPDALLLVGTVLTAEQAELAIAAGAAGLVSPDYFPSVVRTCVGRDVMCIPGGLGDVGKQLVQKAELYGCPLAELRQRYPYQWVHKLFPALSAGPRLLDLVGAWKAVYEGLTVVYTGGVCAENLPEIVQRDPQAIVCGSALTRNLEDADAMHAEAQRWLDVIHSRKPSIAPQTAPVPKPPGAQTRTVVTFGETMLRLTAAKRRRLSQATALDVSFGGAEANVAVALAHWGVPARFVTALPDQPLAQAALSTLRGYGVDTSFVLQRPGRLGVYYLEQGAAQRAAQVIYDRAGSSLAELPPGQIDWDRVFADATWFHWSGITPALSATAAENTREALQAARRAGVTVSADLNYRARLWTPDQARQVLTPLMEYVQIALANEEDAGYVFGLRPAPAGAPDEKTDPQSYRRVAEQLLARFGFRMVGFTLRESWSASHNRWSACLHDGQHFHQSRRYDIHVVDRVGAGDAFAAGLIYGLRAGMDAPAALEFATAAGCLKHSIPGDFNLVSAEEVAALACGEATGRVRR